MCDPVYNERMKTTEPCLIASLSPAFSHQPRQQNSPFPCPCHKQGSVNRATAVYSLERIRPKHFQTKGKEHSEENGVSVCVCVW